MNGKELIYVKELEEKYALLQAENKRLRRAGYRQASAIKAYRDFPTMSTLSFAPVEDELFEAEDNWREVCGE